MAKPATSRYSGLLLPRNATWYWQGVVHMISKCDIPYIYMCIMKYDLKSRFWPWWPWPMTLTFKVDIGVMNVHILTKFHTFSCNTYGDMNYFLHFRSSTDRQSDRKRCIWAHLCNSIAKVLNQASSTLLGQCYKVLLSLTGIKTPSWNHDQVDYRAIRVYNFISFTLFGRCYVCSQVEGSLGDSLRAHRSQSEGMLWTVTLEKLSFER